MSDLKPSVRATYDSRETGPRYWVTTELGDRTIGFRQPQDDPFVNTVVVVGWRDLLAALLFRGRLIVRVVVGGDKDVCDDVLELDENAIVPGRTRRAAFHQSMHGKLAAFGEAPVSSSGATP